MRRKEVIALAEELEQRLGCRVFEQSDILDVGEINKNKTVIQNGRAVALYLDTELFLTLYGLVCHPATKRWVTVDMGAVGYIANGADVMAPGIVDVDRSISPGDGVWIRDEKNLQPLAIGKALMDAGEMLKAKDGKA